MKIFVAHPSNSQFEEELYTPLKNCALTQTHTFFFPHDFGFDKVTRNIVEENDLVVAEVSLPSTGQGIEIGWATAKGIPVVCFYKKGSTPSGALPFVTKDILEYSDTDDMIAKLTGYLNTLSH
jgi:hypothetical protein